MRERQKGGRYGRLGSSSSCTGLCHWFDRSCDAQQVETELEVLSGTELVARRQQGGKEELKMFVTLPNGDSIRTDAIVAVRKGDAAPANDYCRAPMVPRVIVDYICGDHGNCVICECESNAERDKLATSITALANWKW